MPEALRVRLAAPLLVAVLLFSGCLGGGPDPAPEPAASERYLHLDDLPFSEVRFGSLPAESLWFAASTDDQTMHMVVWRPDVTTGPAPDPEWKAPVVLIDTPYRTTLGRQDPLDPHEPTYLERYDWLLEELVPRGYAVVHKEVRGTGESGGCLEQTASTQRQDGYDAVEFLAAQEWSNGKVGMFGRSYLGETQFGAAVLAPPSLVTIIPVASISGQYEWNNYDGVPFTLHTLIGNAAYLATSGAAPGTTPQGVQNYPSHYECQAEMMAQGLDMSGDWNDYWQERELRDLFPGIEASVLYVHGLQDWNVRPVAVRDAWDRIESEKRLILGQWAHNFPGDNPSDPMRGRSDWKAMVHAWYDHHLLGMDNGILERLPTVQVQDSQGAWRAEADYPPADALDRALFLSPEGLVPDDPGEFSLLLRENQEAFLRAQGLGSIPDFPTDQPTELTFRSAPLDADLRFSGWPVLDFELRLFDGLIPLPPDGMDANFAANLYVTDCDDAGWLNAGYLSARHRDGVKEPKVVPKDQFLPYSLRFHPADTVVPAGCVIELRFAGSDRVSQPAMTFWGAELRSGVLHFPSIERDLARVGLAAPVAA